MKTETKIILIGIAGFAGLLAVHAMTEKKKPVDAAANNNSGGSGGTVPSDQMPLIDGFPVYGNIPVLHGPDLGPPPPPQLNTGADDNVILDPFQSPPVIAQGSYGTSMAAAKGAW